MTEQKARHQNSPIYVYCFPKEKALIQANAEMAGLPVSSFLRLVGQGYRVTGIIDFEHMKELCRVNGDLGRLGGLLKLWLSDDVRLKPFGRDHILALLERIDQRSLAIMEMVRDIASYTGRSNAPKNLGTKFRNTHD